MMKIGLFTEFIPLITSLILASLMLVSCEREEMVYCTDDRPDSLIPILKINEEAKYLCELIFDGLVNKTTLAEGRESYEWALVDKYQERGSSPEDRFFITIYLKKGVLWHDGREFIAEDVIYTWKAINQSDSPIKGWLNTFIEDITAVETDNYQVRIKLRIQRSEEAFQELFSPLKILPRWYTYEGQRRELPFNLNDGSDISEEFKWNPIGTGPYKIRERKSESVELVANESQDYTYYLMKPSAPEIKRINMQVKPDMVKAVKALKKEQLALLFDVQPGLFGELDKEPLKNETYFPYSFHAIVYNARAHPFDNLDFRRAIGCGTNKRELAQRFIGASERDLAQCINSSIFPAKSRYVLADPGNFLDHNSFDPDKAEGYLNHSGIADKTFRLLVSSQVEGYERIGQFTNAYRDMMERIGIAVVIEDLNSNMYRRNVREHNFQAALWSFSGFDHFYDIRALFGEDETYNVWGINSSELLKHSFDRSNPDSMGILDRFGVTLSWEELRSLAAQAHSSIEKLTPACFLFTVPRRAYYSDRLANVSIHPEVGFSTVERWQLLGEMK